MLWDVDLCSANSSERSLVSRYRRGSYQVIKYSHLSFLEHCLCCAVRGAEGGESKHQSLTNLFPWSWWRSKQNIKWSEHWTSFIRWTQVTLWLLVAHTHRAVNVWLKRSHICSFLWVKVWLDPNMSASWLRWCSFSSVSVSFRTKIKPITQLSPGFTD